MDLSFITEELNEAVHKDLVEKSEGFHKFEFHFDREDYVIVIIGAYYFSQIPTRGGDVDLAISIAIVKLYLQFGDFEADISNGYISKIEKELSC